MADVEMSSSKPRSSAFTFPARLGYTRTALISRPPLRSEQGTTFHRHPPSCPTRQQEGYQDVSHPIRHALSWCEGVEGRGTVDRDRRNRTTLTF